MVQGEGVGGVQSLSSGKFSGGCSYDKGSFGEVSIHLFIRQIPNPILWSRRASTPRKETRRKVKCEDGRIRKGSRDRERNLLPQPGQLMRS